MMRRWKRNSETLKRWNAETQFTSQEANDHEFMVYSRVFRRRITDDVLRNPSDDRKDSRWTTSLPGWRTGSRDGRIHHRSDHSFVTGEGKHGTRVIDGWMYPLVWLENCHGIALYKCVVPGGAVPTRRVMKRLGTVFFFLARAFPVNNASMRQMTMHRKIATTVDSHTCSKPSGIIRGRCDVDAEVTALTALTMIRHAEYSHRAFKDKFGVRWQILNKAYYRNGE
jgi:hypothetical protein